jgi:putative holliday junction resolvase
MTPSDTGRVLAIDLGDKRIGLALSDPLGITAQGLPSILRTGPDVEFKVIQGICETQGVTECVVGLPLLLSGEIGHQAKTVHQWIERLTAKISCKIKTWDERLTSRQAARLMIHQGLSRKKQKEKSDQLSAILILQNYLENRRQDSGRS